MLESVWKYSLSLFLYVHLDNSKRICIQSDYDTHDPWLLVFICCHCLIFINLGSKVVSKGNQQLEVYFFLTRHTRVNLFHNIESEKLNKPIVQFQKISIPTQWNLKILKEWRKQVFQKTYFKLPISPIR